MIKLPKTRFLFALAFIITLSSCGYKTEEDTQRGAIHQSSSEYYNDSIKPETPNESEQEHSEDFKYAEECVENSNYEYAIELFKNIPTNSNEYELAQSKIKETEEKYLESILKDVDNYVINNSYIEALETVSNGQEYFIDNDTLNKKYSEVYELGVSYYINDSTKLLSDGKTDLAFSSISYLAFLQMIPE